MNLKLLDNLIIEKYEASYKEELKLKSRSLDIDISMKIIR